MADSPLRDNAWDLDALVLADLPFNAYYPSDEARKLTATGSGGASVGGTGGGVFAPAVPGGTPAGGGLGGYAPFIIPARPRRRLAVVPVGGLVASGRATVVVRRPAPAIVWITPDRPPHRLVVAAGAGVVVADGIAAGRRRRRHAGTGGVACTPAARVDYVNFTRDVVVPDDDEVLALL